MHEITNMHLIIRYLEQIYKLSSLYLVSIISKWKQKKNRNNYLLFDALSFYFHQFKYINNVICTLSNELTFPIWNEQNIVCTQSSLVFYFIDFLFFFFFSYSFALPFSFFFAVAASSIVYDSPSKETDHVPIITNKRNEKMKESKKKVSEHKKRLGDEGRKLKYLWINIDLIKGFLWLYSFYFLFNLPFAMQIKNCTAHKMMITNEYAK